MTKLVFILGTIGGFITYLFGGWDAALIILIVFMVVDYITGIINAAVFKNSGKSENGALSSKAGLKGLLRKGCILLIVLVACQLDILLKTDMIRSVTIIGFCINEVVSIIENAGCMGIPIPQIIRNAVDILKNKVSNDVIKVSDKVDVVSDKVDVVSDKVDKVSEDVKNGKQL